MTKFAAQSLFTRFGTLAMAALLSTSAMAHGNDGHSHDHAKANSRHNDAAHVHGQGELEIVQDGNGLFISLYSPLENVLGFERAPKTDAERVKARRVVSLLRANGLFAFSPEAQCKRTSHKLYSEILNPHSHGQGDDHQHHDSADGHSDFRAAYEFECEQPGKLKAIDVRVFRQFPGFEKIEVQALFPKGQVGATLTPKQSTLVVQ
ncbi:MULTISPECIES: DUF2796 domain-containing protein [unclassified Limnobacter]|uniref:DUF2796 domain-containing protein n=1 Tax=unclassified Limnobacter TaxID=2630203 RepID=UPI000AF40004|nr:DUF2796 domain-containing protein [Limnobacter sp. CACIAM 66H1]